MTSFIGGSASAAAASERATTAEVTRPGLNPAATSSSSAGMAARACTRPVVSVQHREYMASMGSAGSAR